MWSSRINKKKLVKALEAHDWSEGAGPKLKQILTRGVGVHHAGVLPRYRRIVETLFQDKLLSVCVCTETLAAGINLPARSIVLPTLLKGPPGKMKLIEPSSAHQMFGRAGRPQYDDQGFVFALPHEDDVKILRWQEKFDKIPADTKDAGLLKAKKQLKKKMPKRREGVQYWNESQFTQLIQAQPANLASRGALPWRMLAYMLDISPEVEPIRQLVDKRLLKGKPAERAQEQLNQMLLTLWRAGYVELEPRPQLGPSPSENLDQSRPVDSASDDASEATGDEPSPTASIATLDLGQRSRGANADTTAASKKVSAKGVGGPSPSVDAATKNPSADNQPKLAHPTDRLAGLLSLRGVHPLYGMFLMNHLGIADQSERIQAMESLLEMPRSLGRAVRVPGHDELPPGPLATTRLDDQLLKLGLATAEELQAPSESEDDDPRRGWLSDDERVYVLSLAHKLHRLFNHDFPGVDDFKVWPVWVAGELLEFGGDFNKYITGKSLQKQEGMIFRHLLRLILLIDELAQLGPPDVEFQQWQDELGEIADRIEESCRRVDSQGTEQWLAEGKKADTEL